MKLETFMLYALACGIGIFLIYKFILRFVVRYRVRYENGKYYPEVRDGIFWLYITHLDESGKNVGYSGFDNYEEACHVIDIQERKVKKYYYP